MTHRERLLRASRGELADFIPYVPRIDIWYAANERAGTLPAHCQGKTEREVSLGEGWALHRMVPDFRNTLHGPLGLYVAAEMAHDIEFDASVEVVVSKRDSLTKVTYRTPVGEVTTESGLTEEMIRDGSSLPWVAEYPLKKLQDYRVVQYLFEHLRAVPNYEGFVKWQSETGDDGLCVAIAALRSSPMHHIQKMMDPTQFYYSYHDHPAEMRALEKAVGSYYDQVLSVLAGSPAEAINWGGNFDDTITYPEFFKKEISPWLCRASEVLGGEGKLVMAHCDGENRGLMDLIRDSGVHVAEAVCPHPMTKVTLAEYYARWTDRLSIWGGVPSNLVLAESTTDEEFEAYLDELFRVVGDGRRLVVEISDTVPPGAKFERLVRIGERLQEEGRLPLLAGSARPLTSELIDEVAARVAQRPNGDSGLESIRKDVMEGNDDEICLHIDSALKSGFSAEDILNRAMLVVMGIIGERFRTGEAFIPEVLLSARAMNEGVRHLGPLLGRSEDSVKAKILIGTVRGDMHDIGKNLVGTMLQASGFEVQDVGMNVSPESFVKYVAEERPDILGLSALLTTTMHEMKNVIDQLERNGLRGTVKVIVGGAPVNAKFAQDIGADGYADNAGEAVDLVKSLLSAATPEGVIAC